MTLKTGDVAPEFSLPGSDGKMHTLAMYRGKRVLLYFYPKDNTSGCTVEAETMRDTAFEFSRHGVVVLGVSTDSLERHEAFAKKLSLNFPLLADIDKKVVRAYGVWGKKKMMGKEYMGIQRMSFLVDIDGKVLIVYNTVKPKEHAEEVLRDVRGS